MALAIVKHNAPIQMAETLSPLVKEIFPDSKIAQSFASSRTKTRCIINGALKPYFK